MDKSNFFTVKVAENVTPYEVYLLTQKGLVPTECAIRQVEQSQHRGIALVAYLMACEGFASAEWARAQIERGIGDILHVAPIMVKNGLATQEWADEIIKKHKGKQQ